MRYFLLTIIFTAFLLSCGIDTSRKKKDRITLIEELTKIQTDTLRVQLDSLCILKKEAEFDILKDSLLDAKLTDIKNKLKEYSNK